MTYRKRFEITRPMGVSVIVGYDPEYQEFRCRLKNNGVSHVEADYFTPSERDARDTAGSLADTAYRAQQKVVLQKMEPAEVKRLCDICYDIWQYIGSDLLSGSTEPLSNEAAVEVCFDALLTCNVSPAAAQEDHMFCKAMYQKYGFDTVTIAVASKLNLV